MCLHPLAFRKPFRTLGSSSILHVSPMRPAQQHDSRAGRLKKPTKAAVKKAARSARWEVQQPSAGPLQAHAPNSAAPGHLSCPPGQNGGAGPSQPQASQSHANRVQQPPAQAPVTLATTSASSNLAQAMQRQKRVDHYIDRCAFELGASARAWRPDPRLSGLPCTFQTLMLCRPCRRRSGWVMTATGCTHPRQVTRELLRSFVSSA